MKRHYFMSAINYDVDGTVKHRHITADFPSKKPEPRIVFDSLYEELQKGFKGDGAISTDNIQVIAFNRV